MSDQFWWARRIHELGVSSVPIPRRKLSAEDLGAAILSASNDPAMRDRAASLGRRIDGEDGVACAVAAFQRQLAGASPAAVVSSPL